MEKRYRNDKNIIKIQLKHLLKLYKVMVSLFLHVKRLKINI